MRCDVARGVIRIEDGFARGGVVGLYDATELIVPVGYIIGPRAWRKQPESDDEGDHTRNKPRMAISVHEFSTRKAVGQCAGAFSEARGVIVVAFYCREDSRKLSIIVSLHLPFSTFMKQRSHAD